MTELTTRGTRTFHTNETAWGSPVLPALAAYNSEMYARGFNDAYIQTAEPDDRVLWSAVEGKLIGFIAYRFWGRDSHVVHITAAWVQPAWRGAQSGEPRVYDELFEVFAEHVRDAHDIWRVSSGTHVNNRSAQRAFERQGRVLRGYSYDYDIPPKVELPASEPQPNFLSRSWTWLGTNSTTQTLLMQFVLGTTILAGILLFALAGGNQ